MSLPGCVMTLFALVKGPGEEITNHNIAYNRTALDHQLWIYY